MVFFLAPVAVTGYMYYQKQQKEQEQQEEQQKCLDDNTIEDDDDYVDVVGLVVSDDQHEGGPAAFQDPIQEADENAEIPDMVLANSAVSSTSSSSSSVSSEETCDVTAIPKKKDSNSGKKQQQQQAQLSQWPLISQEQKEQLSKMVNDVTQSWSTKFQAFCKDWEQEIREARSRGIRP